MKSYSQKWTSHNDRLFLARAKRLVSFLPDDIACDPEWPHHPVDIRCHELARAIGTMLDLPVVDGQYGIADHSWLEISHPTERKILDVYSVGQLPQVQLLILNWKLPHAKLYKPGPVRTDIRSDVVDRMVAFLRQHTTTTQDAEAL